MTDADCRDGDTRGIMDMVMRMVDTERSIRRHIEGSICVVYINGKMIVISKLIGHPFRVSFQWTMTTHVLEKSFSLSIRQIQHEKTFTPLPNLVLVNQFFLSLSIDVAGPLQYYSLYYVPILLKCS